MASFSSVAGVDPASSESLSSSSTLLSISSAPRLFLALMFLELLSLDSLMTPLSLISFARRTRISLSVSLSTQVESVLAELGDCCHSVFAILF